MADGNLGDIAPREREYQLYLDERKQLIDAARESARTFDKAVLTFGSAAFGFSIAFVKDIAPNPASFSLKWLEISWILFSLGLLAILLSFLYSHQACMFEIKVGEDTLGKQDFKRKRNPWSIATNWCNGLCIALLFLGLLCWTGFAVENLRYGGMRMNKVQLPVEKKGYVPPPAAPKPPSTQPSQKPTSDSQTPKK